jgi:hypothetical protein
MTLVEPQNELSIAKEKLKSFVLQYVLICKLIVKYKPMIDSPTKTAEEYIKCDKIVKAFDKSVNELLKEFEVYFELERKLDAPVNLTFRSSYKKLKENKNRVI